MKKTLFLLFVVSCSLFSFSCKTVNEVLADRKFDNKVAESELERLPEGNVYPFTLDSDYNYGCPVVRYPINGQIGTFVVDTGAPGVLLTSNGIKKLGVGVDKIEQMCLPYYVKFLEQCNPKLFRRIKDDPEKLLAQLRKDQKKGYNIPFYTDKEGDFSNFWYGQSRDTKKDGFIGLTILEKYGRVTFDFVNNVMILGGERLEGNSTPMARDANGCWCIEFLYKGKKEVAMIDTGNYTFSPRNNFGKDDNIYNLTDGSPSAAEVLYKKTPKKMPFVHTFSDIEICGVKKDGIKGVYSNCWFSTYTVTSQQYLTKVNGIGCELFKGNVIQLDFEAKEFIIK